MPDYGFATAPLKDEKYYEKAVRDLQFASGSRLDLEASFRAYSLDKYNALGREDDACPSPVDFQLLNRCIVSLD